MVGLDQKAERGILEIEKVVYKGASVGGTGPRQENEDRG